MSLETRAQLLASLPSVADLSADFWRRMPEGLTMNPTGLVVEGMSGPGVVMWDTLASMVATLTCKLQQMRETVGLPSLELPSLEDLHNAFPKIEIAELERIRFVLETMVVPRPTTAEKVSPNAMPEKISDSTAKAFTDKPLSDEMSASEETPKNTEVIAKEEAEDKNTELHQRPPSKDSFSTPLSQSSLDSDVISTPSGGRKLDATWAEAVETLRRMLWPDS